MYIHTVVFTCVLSYCKHSSVSRFVLLQLKGEREISPKMENPRDIAGEREEEEEKAREKLSSVSVWQHL